MSNNQKTYRRADLVSDLEDFARFVRAQSHVLARKAALTFQQAVNEPDSTAPARAAHARMEAGLETRPWLQYVNKPQSHSACLRTIAGHTNHVRACAFSPDGSRILSASGDKTLKLWDAKTGVQIWDYELGGKGVATAWSHRGGDLAAGDNLGHLLILRLQNFSFGPVLVTAWQHNPHRWIPWMRLHYRFGCPLCRVWSEVAASALGSVIPCPNCGSSIKLNPFTINADWRPIAAAWKSVANDN